MISERYELLIEVAANHRIRVSRVIEDEWYWWQDGVIPKNNPDMIVGPYPNALAALEEGCKPWIETLVA
jgi:hypothetical protein